MPIKTRDARANLLSKGFREERGGDHLYLRFQYKGKETGQWTKYSHGALGDDINDSLLHLMKRQLGLSTNSQARQLIDCSMSEAAYIKALQDIGKLPATKLAAVPAPAKPAKKK